MVKFCVVSVNVIACHAQIQELLIGLLFFGRISEGGAEPILKLCPEDFIHLG